MNKYLGSKITAFGAIIAPIIFVVVPLMFSVIILSSTISIATVLLTMLCIACALIWVIYIRINVPQLYSWGKFRSDGVWVRTLFSHKYLLNYENCKSCGIGFYTHGILNSKAGNDVYFIFLSYDKFDEKFRSQINLWKPSRNRIKVGFSKSLYDYLITTLPAKQRIPLEQDFDRYIETQHKRFQGRK